MPRKNRRKATPQMQYGRLTKPRKAPTSKAPPPVHVPDHGTCEAQRKKKFTKTEADAIADRARRANSITRTEKHSYHCPECLWWHTTSQTSTGGAR